MFTCFFSFFNIRPHIFFKNFQSNKWGEIPEHQRRWSICRRLQFERTV